MSKEIVIKEVAQAEFGGHEMFDEMRRLFDEDLHAIIEFKTKKDDLWQAGFLVSVQNEGGTDYFQIENVRPEDLSEFMYKYCESQGFDIMPGGIYRIPLLKD